MLVGYIKFNSIPKIGFAHHFHSKKYTYDYALNNNSFEIIYITSGSVYLEFNNETYYAHERDILVLFRHLPIKLYTASTKEHAHCTVQLEFDYTFELIDPEYYMPDKGVILPFIIPDTFLTGEIKRILFSIVEEISSSPSRSSFSAALKTVEVLQKIDSVARDIYRKTNPFHSHMAALVKSYVADNLHKKISLDDIAKSIGKSPNYINFAFKEVTGSTITEYVNDTKITMIITLMQKQNMQFAEACNNVGITNISYGYRLFKKHTGLTPNALIKSEKFTLDQG